MMKTKSSWVVEVHKESGGVEMFGPYTEIQAKAARLAIERHYQEVDEKLSAVFELELRRWKQIEVSK